MHGSLRPLFMMCWTGLFPSPVHQPSRPGPASGWVVGAWTLVVSPGSPPLREAGLGIEKLNLL